jgi:hypothetical protein
LGIYTGQDSVAEGRPSDAPKADMGQRRTAYDYLTSSGELPTITMGELFRHVWGVTPPVTKYEDSLASHRATKLLLKQITHEEFLCLKANGYIPVYGAFYNFQIYLRKFWNVRVLYKSGAHFGWIYSTHTDYHIPLIDQIVSQYIHLKTSETYYMNQMATFKAVESPPSDEE